MSRTAVVLFNLGGPDSLESVRPFLFNLFNDPAIIGLPAPLRRLVAGLIARRRAPVARAIYEKLGGASPLLANTELQAKGLEASLGAGYRCFIAMRCWHPLIEEAVSAVKEWGPERVVLLPLYPQFSTTTTASSIAEWKRAAEAAKLAAPCTTICCYPAQRGFIEAIAERVREALGRLPSTPEPRVLFSAHGLPEKVIRAGDPYQWQVERTVAAVVDAIGRPQLDWVVCYQSRVGPLAWIGPPTDAEIRRAGSDRVPVVVVPVAFVSEHSETLVELDIDYRRIAEETGVPAYIRVPTVGASAPFVNGLAEQVQRAATVAPGIRSGEGGRVCPAGFACCPAA